MTNSPRKLSAERPGAAALAGKPGELEIDQAEAEIVRRIFFEFVDGKTPREIAAGLNADGVKPLRGNNWNASTINGNAARGHGMLINELYAAASSGTRSA